MTNWLNGCEMCNTGIVETIEKHKGDGLSVRKACEAMAKEAAQKFPELKEDLSASRIRARYKRQMPSGTIRPTEKVKDENSAPLVTTAEINKGILRTVSEYCRFFNYQRMNIPSIRRGTKLYKKCEELRDLMVELFPYPPASKDIIDVSVHERNAIIPGAAKVLKKMRFLTYDQRNSVLRGIADGLEEMTT